MNLRILKKLSKRAAPYLPLLGDDRGQFITGPDFDGECVRDGIDRKHCQLWGGKYRSPFNVWPGTVSVGAMYGGESPEWSDEDAYSALQRIVHDLSIDWETGETVERHPCPRIPKEVFRLADRMARAA